MKILNISAVKIQLSETAEIENVEIARTKITKKKEKENGSRFNKKIMVSQKYNCFKNKYWKRTFSIYILNLHSQFIMFPFNFLLTFIGLSCYSYLKASTGFNFEAL